MTTLQTLEQEYGARGIITAARQIWPDADRQTPCPDAAQLGLASTEQLMRELICRFRMEVYVPGISTATTGLSVDRALALAEMLGGMGAPEREYRTVDA